MIPLDKVFVLLMKRNVKTWSRKLLLLSFLGLLDKVLLKRECFHLIGYFFFFEWKAHRL